MAFLPQIENTNVEAILANASSSGGGLPLIPEGKYPAIFVESDIKPTSKGGQQLVMKAVLTQGAHANTEFRCGFNIVNDNEVARKIAYEDLARIAKACGLTTIPQDSAQFHNKPITITVKTKKGQPYQDKMTGEQRMGNDYSEVKGYEAAFSGGQAPIGTAQASGALPWKK